METATAKDWGGWVLKGRPETEVVWARAVATIPGVHGATIPPISATSRRKTVIRLTGTTKLEKLTGIPPHSCTGVLPIIPFW
jgi:hypothetical protein